MKIFKSILEEIFDQDRKLKLINKWIKILDKELLYLDIQQKLIDKAIKTIDDTWVSPFKEVNKNNKEGVK